MINISGLRIIGFIGAGLTVAFTQSVTDLPFDWSGQHGLRTVNGHLLWHQDWSSGPLLFDRSAVNYPARLGDGLTGRFAVLGMGDLPVFSEIPDSTIVTNQFYYQRGDFNFDQLAVKAVFAEPGSKINLTGFKRSFSGSMAELIFTASPEQPLQQVYRIDFSKSQEQDLLELSTFLAVTNSGLPDSIERGFQKEQLTAGGILFQHGLSFGLLNIHAGQILNEYSSVRPSRDTTYTRRFARSYLTARLGKQLKSTADISLMIKLDQQAAPQILRTWYSILGEYQTPALITAAGISIIDLTASPLLKLNLKQSLANLDFQLSLAYLKQRVPLELYSRQPDRSSEWTLADLSVGKNNGKVTMTIAAGIRQSPDYHFLAQIAGTDQYDSRLSTAYLGFLTSELDWQINQDWYLAFCYRHIDYDQVTLTDGIRDRVKLGIEGKLKFLLKDRLDLFARLDIQGWLNRDPNFGFDLYQNIPYQMVTAEINENKWPVSFQLRAVISSVTITYQIDNLLYKMAPLLVNINSSFLTDNYGIIGNDLFPPMGSLVRFGIEWNFEK